MCWFPVCTNNIKRKHWVSTSRALHIIRSCPSNIYKCIKRVLKQRKPPSYFECHTTAALFSSQGLQSFPVFKLLLLSTSGLNRLLSSYHRWPLNSENWKTLTKETCFDFSFLKFSFLKFFLRVLSFSWGLLPSFLNESQASWIFLNPHIDILHTLPHDIHKNRLTRVIYVTMNMDLKCFLRHIYSYGHEMVSGVSRDGRCVTYTGDCIITETFASEESCGVTTTDTQKYSNTMLHKHECTHESSPPQAAAIKLGGPRGERNDTDRNIWQLYDGIFKKTKKTANTTHVVRVRKKLEIDQLRNSFIFQQLRHKLMLPPWCRDVFHLSEGS